MAVHRAHNCEWLDITGLLFVFFFLKSSNPDCEFYMDMVVSIEFSCLIFILTNTILKIEKYGPGKKNTM